MAADSSDSDSSKGNDPTDDSKRTGLGEAAPDGAAADRSAERPVTDEQPEASGEPRPTDGSAAGDSRADDESEATDENAEEPVAAGDADEKHSATGDSETGRIDEDSRPYPPALIATAVALPVVLVVAVLVAAVLARRLPVEREPLALGPVPAPAAEGEACTKLLPALPADLGEFTKSTLVEPAPPATRAWQRPEGGNAIVLRCGLDRPLEFHRASPLQIVDGVQWFEVRDDSAETSTWFAVDRETYIALTVPDGSGPTPLQEVSDTITANLPAKELDPGPLPN
ncbi:DUF3515 domain-containing protein [Nocardia xishanensis]